MNSKHDNEYSLAANWERVDLVKQVPLAKPLSINLETTSLCNFNCRFCSRNGKLFSGVNRPSFMSGELLDKIIIDLQNWKGDKIKAFTMHVSGEPFVTPGFDAIIKKIRDADIVKEIQITSNGALLTEQICKRLIESKVDYIRFSIYSMTQERHEKITGSKADIEAIYQNIKTLYALRNSYGSKVPYISTKFFNTFSEENQMFIEKYQAVSDETIILPVFEIPGVTPPLENTYGENTEQLKSAKKQYADFMDVSKKKCAIPFYKMVIYSNGDVGLCCDDFAGNLSVGNIENTPIKEIWNGSKAQELRLKFLRAQQSEYDVCKNCTIFQHTIFTYDNIEALTPEIYEQRMEIPE